MAHLLQREVLNVTLVDLFLGLLVLWNLDFVQMFLRGQDLGSQNWRLVHFSILDCESRIAVSFHLLPSTKVEAF